MEPIKPTTPVPASISSVPLTTPITPPGGFTTPLTGKPAAVIPKPPEESTGPLQIFPELVLYALSVYAYYFAAKQAAKDIESDDPSANKLFKLTPLHYSFETPPVDDPSTISLEKDAEAAKKALLTMASGDPERASEAAAIISEAEAEETAEETVEGSGESSDIG